MVKNYIKNIRFCCLQTVLVYLSVLYSYLWQLKPWERFCNMDNQGEGVDLLSVMLLGGACKGTHTSFRVVNSRWLLI